MPNGKKKVRKPDPRKINLKTSLARMIKLLESGKVVAIKVTTCYYRRSEADFSAHLLRELRRIKLDEHTPDQIAWFFHHAWPPLEIRPTTPEKQEDVDFLTSMLKGTFMQAVRAQAQVAV